MTKFLSLALAAFTLSLAACSLQDTSGGNACGDACTTGTTCNTSTGKCVADDDSSCGGNCSGNTVCNRDTGKCQAANDTDCGGVCGTGTVCNTSTGKCDQTDNPSGGDNYCDLTSGPVYGSTDEIGYETNANAGQLGRGQWKNASADFALSSINGGVRVTLNSVVTNAEAVRISARISRNPSVYLASGCLTTPVAHASVRCRINGRDLTLSARNVQTTDCGSEFAGSFSGTIPNPIRNN